MTVASALQVLGCDDELLRHVHARFSRPVTPGTLFELSVQDTDEPGRYALSLRDAEGSPVLRNAWIAVDQ